jgi:hypothetical protein
MFDHYACSRVHDNIKLSFLDVNSVGCLNSLDAGM